MLRDRDCVIKAIRWQKRVCDKSDLSRAVELAGLDVEGCSLLDGAEAGDAEGLTGLGDGVDPAADVLELLAAAGVLLLGDESAVLVEHEVALGQAGLVLLAGAVPHLAAGSTDANTTGHFELLSLCERATNGIRERVNVITTGCSGSS